MLKNKETDISSAEMTAYWRSLYPKLSSDTLSINLATAEGIQKATVFEEKFNYPLVGRKVSVRAGFMLQKSTEILSTGLYDSCISLGSGFSMLTYMLAEQLNRDNDMPIQFIDLDLLEIIKERKRRISRLIVDKKISADVLSTIQNVDIDIEAMHTTDISFKGVFRDCKRPLFIIEGLIYFLTQDCVKWLMQQITRYDLSAVIFDYWPENGVNESLCFCNAIQAMAGFMPENVKSFWSDEGIAQLSGHFKQAENLKIKNIENEMSEKNLDTPRFIDSNTFFPVQIFVGQGAT